MATTTRPRATPLARAAPLLLLAAVVALLGLGAGGAAPQLSRMVLQLSDLPTGWYRVSAHPQRADLSNTTAAERSFVLHNRLGGYEAQFRPTALVDPGTGGVFSYVTSWRTAKAASSAVAKNVARFMRLAPHAQRLPLPRPVGQNSHLLGTIQKISDDYVGMLTLIWRHDTLVSHVSLVGLMGYLRPALVVQLARRQDARIARQLG
jgi:hypothetical protein